MQFTGDAAEQQLKQAIINLFQLNELGNASPYTLSFSGGAASGYSFGYPQFDLSKPPSQAVTSLFTQILTNATDSSGAYLVDPELSGTARGAAIQALVDDAEVPGGQSLSLFYLNQINSALSSSYGVAQIDSYTDSYLSTLISQISEVDDSLTIADQTQFGNTQLFSLLVADTLNWFGPSTNFINQMTEASQSGAFSNAGGLSFGTALLNYITFNKANSTGTIFGPAQAFRRLANVVSVAEGGAYQPVSEADARAIIQAYSLLYLPNEARFSQPSNAAALQSFQGTVVQNAASMLVGDLQGQFGSVVGSNFGTNVYVGVDNGPATPLQPTRSVLDGTGDSNDDLLMAGAGAYTVIAGSGDDLLISGNGNDSLEAGSGNDTLIANGGNDTLKGDGNDLFDVVAGGGGYTTTIEASDGQEGSVEVYANSVATTLSGSSSAPTVSTNGKSLTWEGTSGQPTYTYTSDGTGQNTGTLVITGGALGASAIDVQNFNLAAAQSPGGFLGVQLGGSASLSFGTTPNSPDPDFIAGSSQTYTLSTDVSTAASRTVTLSLGGVDASAFLLQTDGTTISPSDDGTFSFSLPAGASSASFTLLNVTDVGQNTPMQLTASVTNPQDSTETPLSTNALEFNYVEPANDPFQSIAPSPLYYTYDESLNPSYTAYTDSPESADVPSALSPGDGGDDLIVSNGNGTGSDTIGENINGGAGNDTIDTGFDWNSNSALDVVQGHGGQDIIWDQSGVGMADVDGGNAPPYQVQIYGDTQVDLATAIADANAAGVATGEQGDVILSGAPEATLVGGLGNDYISDYGNDVVVAGPGDDTIVGGSDDNMGDKIAAGDPEGLTWSAQYENGLLVMGGDLYHVTSGDGSTPANYEGNVDTEGRALGNEANTVYGGAGNDLIELSNGDNDVQLGVGNSTVLGGMGNDSIFGGSGADFIQGGGGNDYIATGTGNSAAIGRGGNNTIIGGGGNDTIDAGGGSTDADPNAWTDSETGNNSVNGGSGNDWIYGSGGNDTLVAGTGNSSIWGGAGSESIVGGTGNDYLVGGSGNDTIEAAGNGNDTLIGQASSSNTTLLYGGDGSDSLQGDDGTDVIDVGNGNSTVVAGSGATTVVGGDGTDWITGGSGVDWLAAGDGGTEAAPTSVVASGSQDSLYGGSGSDILQGSATGLDYIEAGAGDDTIFGSGFDTIVAGSGNDYIDGGSGYDTYVMDEGVGSVDIADPGSGVIEFGAGVLPEDLSVTAAITAYGQAALEIDGDGSISIDGALAGAGPSIEFLDPSASESYVTLSQLIAQYGFDQSVAGANGNLVFNLDNGRAIAGGSGSDTIVATGNNDTITGGAQSDFNSVGGSDTSVVGGQGNDTISSSGGQDTLVSGSAPSTLIGGGTQTAFVISNASDVVEDTISSANDSISSSVSFALTAGIDTLTLTGSENLVGTGNDDGSNVLTGNAGNDTLIAGIGSDTLDSGAGVDTLVAGGGAGTFVINNVADVIQNYASDYSNIIQSSVDFDLSTTPGIDTLQLIGSGNLLATGNGDAQNSITGNFGNDTLVAGTGADTLTAGVGTDTLIAGSGPDSLLGTAGDTYVLNSGFGDTEINATAGDGTVDFGAGINASDLTLSVSSGNPGALLVQDGSSGVVTIDGAMNGAIDQFQFADGESLSLSQLMGEANVTAGTAEGSNGEVIINTAPGASIQGDSGADFIYGTGAADTILGGSGNDAIYGTGAGDVLVGGSGVDTLYGGSGDDTLIGGSNSTTMYGGQGDDTYTLTQGTADTIVPSTASGVEEIYLPAGMSFADFRGYASGNNLVLESQDGNTSLTIEGYYAESGKTWYIASDNDAPDLLSNFLSGTSGNPSSYSAEVAALGQAYSAGLTTQLQSLGASGGSLGSLIDTRDSSFPPVSQYTFTGVTDQAEQVANGVLQIASSEVGSDQTITSNETETVTLPVYTLETVPGSAYEVSPEDIAMSDGSPVGPPGSTVTPVYGQDTLTGQYDGQIVGYLVQMPSKTSEVQTGSTTYTSTVPAYSDVSTRGFIDYDVTGDGANDSITSAGPFVGTVNTGNGNVYVNLGTTSSDGQGDWISGDAPGTSAPLFGSPSPQYAVQPGAFIDAGSGNDTLIGTNGDDVIAAGTGFDSMDGGNGADTYLVPMQGYSTDIITDSGDPAPDLQDLLTGGTSTDVSSYTDVNGVYTIVDQETQGPGAFPLDTLDLPSGVTPTNLQYRVFTSPDYPGQQVLQLVYGGSSVLIPFSPSPQEVDIRPVNVIYEFPTITTPAHVGVDNVKFADGTTMTLSELISQATLLPNDFDATVSATNTAVLPGASVAASSLFTATDSSDDTITWYQISSSGAGGAYFTLNGQAVPAGQTVEVNAGQLADLQYVAGSAGSSDQIQVSAFDQAVWSAVTTLTINPGQTGNQYEATAANQLVSGASIGPDTLIGGYSNDTLAGASGQDTFIYDSGSGPEVVSDSAPPSSSSNTLQFGAGISAGMVTLGLTSTGQLLLTVGSSGDAITFAGFEPLDPSGSLAVQRFEFADGTALSLAQLIAASAGNSSGTLTNPDGTTSSYTFSPSGAELYSAQTVNVSGQVINSYALNSDGSTEAVSYSYAGDGSYVETAVATAINGQSTTTVYDVTAAGQISSTEVTNPNGSATTYNYNPTGQLVGADTTNADGSTNNISYSYNPDGSYVETAIATPSGGGAATTTTYDVNAAGQITATDVTNADGSTVDYGYSGSGQLTSVQTTNADGSTDTANYSYGSDGSYVETVVSTPASGGATTTVYDVSSTGQIASTQVTDPNGSTTTYSYNASSQITSEDTTNADGSTNNVGYAYNGDGSYVETDVATAAGGGNPTTTVYDVSASGQISSTAVTNPDGSSATYDYNSSGQLTSDDTTNADGSTNNVGYAYNGDGSYVETAVAAPAGGGGATTTVYDVNASGQISSTAVTNPDGSSATYDYNNSGQLTSDDATNADGSTNNVGYAYNGDGSYVETAVATPAGGGGATTTVYDVNASGQISSTAVTNPDGSSATYDYNSSGQLTSDDATNADGSTNDVSYAYNGDGSYVETAVATPAGGGGATTTVYDINASGQITSTAVSNPDGSSTTYEYNGSGQLSSDDTTNADGSTNDVSYAYNGDGSYVETAVATPAAGAAPTTTVYDVNSSGQITNENSYELSADGSYTDTWSAQDGSHGSYWWSASSGEYLDSWYNADGSSFSDEYQYSPGVTPGTAGASFTETYSASDGSEGTRQFDGSSGITTLSWDSSSTGDISGNVSNAGFIGLQNEGELTNTQPDLSFFNPNASPTFSAFLAAH